MLLFSIQFAGALSLSVCAGAPQVKFAMGRPPPKAASPPDLVPEPFDSVQKIRFPERTRLTSQEG